MHYGPAVSLHEANGLIKVLHFWGTHQFRESSCRPSELIDQLVREPLGILQTRNEPIQSTGFHRIANCDHLIISVLPNLGDDLEEVLKDTGVHVLAKLHH